MQGRAAVSRGRAVAAVAALAYLGVIAALTLGPGPSSPGPAGPLWTMFTALRTLPGTGWVSFDRFEFSANIAMFAPLGLLLTLWWGRRRGWYGVLAGLAVSVTIEVAQRGIPGRVSDPRDIASNTLGALLGVVAGLVAWRLQERGRRRAQ